MRTQIHTRWFKNEDLRKGPETLVTITREKEWEWEVPILFSLSGRSPYIEESLDFFLCVVTLNDKKAHSY